jgi:hypothetical protein
MAKGFQPSGLLFKRVILLFGAIYFTMITLSNFVDFMDEVGTIHWTFLNSHNLSYVEQVTRVYHVSDVVDKLLLIAVIGIEGFGAALFWRALARFQGNGVGLRDAYRALTWSALVWFAFVFATEFFVAYDAEGVFRELLTISVVSMMAVALLPDRLME